MRDLNWGRVEYGAALQRQKDLVREVQSGAPDAVVFCEHPLTITLGRTSKEANLLAPRSELDRLCAQVVPVDRGGDITLHAPGQMIIYPIINLKRAGLDLKGYLRNLEQVAVDFLRDFDIVAQGDEARRGVWVGRKKIASIGIGVSRWVTYHGMGFNVSTDLKLFQLIRPCGLDVRMTSLEELKGDSPSVSEAVKRFARHFQKVFQ